MCVCICTVIWLQYHIVSWLSIVIAAKQVLWQCDPSPSAEGHPGAPTGFGKGKSTANGGFELGKIIWKYGKTWKNPTLVIEVSEFLAGKLNKLKLNGIVFWSPMEKWDVASLPGDDGWYGASFILRSCGLSTCHDAMATRYGLPEMGNSTQNGTLNEECDNFLLGVTPASGRKTLMITYIVSDAQGCYVDVGRSGGCSTRPATSRLHSRGQSHAGQSSGRGLEQRRYWQIESPMPGRSNIDHDEHWTLMNIDESWFRWRLILRVSSRCHCVSFGVLSPASGIPRPCCCAISVWWNGPWVSIRKVWSFSKRCQWVKCSWAVIWTCA